MSYPSHVQNVPPQGQGQPATYPQSYAVAQPATPRFLNRMNYRVMRDIIANQEVEVKLVGHGWVVGIALTCMSFFQTISGFGYKVLYKHPGTMDECEGEFRRDDVRPWNRSQ